MIVNIIITVALITTHYSRFTPVISEQKKHVDNYQLGKIKHESDGANVALPRVVTHDAVISLLGKR